MGVDVWQYCCRDIFGVHGGPVGDCVLEDITVVWLTLLDHSVWNAKMLGCRFFVGIMEHAMIATVNYWDYTLTGECL